jgi:hypothetical protein
MTISGFGIIHEYNAEEIAKASKKGTGAGAPSSGNASVGRHIVTSQFAGIHGAVAGRPGHKLHAAANEFGSSVGGRVGGGLIGAGIGAAVTRGRGGGALTGAGLGQMAGRYTAVGLQTNRNNKRGLYTAQQKKR